MKTILLSDIGSKEETIIPYALNFTKHINDTIEIIHVVDPVKQKVSSSAHADSQSFEVGRKLNHKEILEREKNSARIKLDKMLSYEASRLNFPLRVNTIVEENTVKARLNKEIGSDESVLILSAADLKGNNFEGFIDFIDITKELSNLSLIIPPGQQFERPERVAIIFDYNTEDKTGFFNVLNILRQFSPALNILAVVEEDKYPDIELNDNAWKSVIRDYTGSSLNITTHLLGTKKYAQAIVDYINQNNFHMVAMPGNTRISTGVISYPRYISGELVEALELPVILY